MDILLADGRVVTCTPSNEYSDLFFGIPNSYGTFGYILRLKVKVIPAKRYVRITHKTFSDVHEYLNAMQTACDKKESDFVEGVVFSEKKFVLSTGQFVNEAPFASDYTYMKIYYRSLLARTEDYLTAKDYIWRWDTDWFWCSSLMYAQNPFVRFFLGRDRLNSIFYTKLMRWNRKWKIAGYIQMIFTGNTEAVIQDIEIPIGNVPAFLDFFHSTVGMRPLINGPVIGSPSGEARFPLFPLDPKSLYVNVGFWGVVKTTHEGGYFNKLIEKKAIALDGMKMLYSDSFYSEEEFWKIYKNKAIYEELKKKYDPNGKFKTLYQKCVLRV